MNIKKTILFALMIIVINLLIAHFLAPFGLMLTPVILIIISSLICFEAKDLKPITRSLLLVALISLHDIGIKLYSGGSHDSKGLGIVHLLLFIGLIPSNILLITSIYQDKKNKWTEKILAIIIFPIIVTGYLYLFSELGLGRHYSYSWN